MQRVMVAAFVLGLLGCGEKPEDREPACVSALDCVNLGLSYKHDKGVPKDEARANALYKQACDGGYQKACEWVR